MNQRKLAVVVSTAAVGATLLACGGLSDPSRQENSLSLSGSLTGTALPSNAHVALVWRSGANGGVTVAADAPVVNGQYSLTIDVPPDSYFFDEDGDAPSGGAGDLGGGASGGSTGNSGGTQFKSGLTPKSDPVGGQVTEPLSHAVAGFLVYVDKNGNGELEAGTDQIIGGDHELSLTYLRGGGSLAYEKLRDRTGIVPHPGFNLGWTEGWLQFDNADLLLSSSARLPNEVCGGGLNPREFPNTVDASAPIPRDAGSGPSPSPNYPAPNDPNLRCSAGGRTFSYQYANTCPPPPVPVPSLCSDSNPGSEPCATPVRFESIPPGSPPPVGWPCPIPNTQPPNDAGGPSPVPTDAGGPSPVPTDAGGPPPVPYDAGTGYP